jgi:hypothetical protein
MVMGKTPFTKAARPVAEAFSYFAERIADFS